MRYKIQKAATQGNFLYSLLENLSPQHLESQDDIAKEWDGGRDRGALILSKMDHRYFLAYAVQLYGPLHSWNPPKAE